MSNTDPIWSIQTTPLQRGKLVYLQEENPINYLSRIKNPNLLYPHIVAALRAYDYVLYRPPWII